MAADKRCPVGELGVELYRLLIGRIERRELTAEEAITGTAAALAELIASEPRSAQRAEVIARLVMGLPRIISRRVQRRLEDDPDYRRAVMEMNPVPGPAPVGKPH